MDINYIEEVSPETVYTGSFDEQYTFAGPDFIFSFVKTHPDAVLPSSNHSDDSGYDITAVEDTIIPARGRKQVATGLEFAHIPEGYWIRIEARSGLGFKKGIVPFSGIIDTAYRGPAGILLFNNTDDDYEVKKGDRIAQLVVYPLIKPEVTFVKSKSETKRGDKGFGSSGN
jgi:dUTP pyrophosphatase